MQSKGLKCAVFGAVGAAAMLLAGVAQAAGVPGQGTWETTLKGRDISGAAVAADSASAVFLYDTALKVTWLRDANVNGLMNWNTAKTWANDLVAGGIVDWRLPTMIDTGSPGCNYSQSGGTDCGYNVQTRSGSTTYSEMAHLWYVALGNKAYYAPGTGIGPQPGWGLTNTGNFQNLQSYYYWYGLEEPGGSEARDLNTEIGNQHHSNKIDRFYAMAVRSGDVLVVPEPTTYALLLAGLTALALARRHQRR